jgi:hypothetical protein
MTTIDVNHDENRSPVVERMEPPTYRRSIVTSAVAAVRVTVEGNGPGAVARIDVAVECGLLDQIDGETVIRAAFFAFVPA